MTQSHPRLPLPSWLVAPLRPHHPLPFAPAAPKAKSESMKQTPANRVKPNEANPLPPDFPLGLQFRPDPSKF